MKLLKNSPIINILYIPIVILLVINNNILLFFMDILLCLLFTYVVGKYILRFNKTVRWVSYKNMYRIENLCHVHHYWVFLIVFTKT